MHNGSLEAEEAGSPSIQVDRVVVAVEASPATSSVSSQLDLGIVFGIDVGRTRIFLCDFALFYLLMEEKEGRGRSHHLCLALKGRRQEVNLSPSRVRSEAADDDYLAHSGRQLESFLLLDSGAHMNAAYREEWECGVRQHSDHQRGSGGLEVK